MKPNNKSTNGVKMGLLKILDFYASKEERQMEVEYQLYSWGCIYPQYIGPDPEHHLSPCYILKVPFKLFNYSPYGQIPQKLSLTLNISQDRQILSGDDNYISIDDAAKEFTAFLSLVTRRRIFLYGKTRMSGLPVYDEVYPYRPSHFQENQKMKIINGREIRRLLENLRSMNRDIGNSFIIATRLYHSAVEMMYTEPEFSYLFLVMCIETIAFSVYKKEDVVPKDKKKNQMGKTELDNFLDSKFPGWKEFCKFMDRKKVIDILLSGEHFDRIRFSRFVIDNVPMHFFSEKEDDAKPYYLINIIKSSGQENYFHDFTIQDYEKIEKSELEKKLKDIYYARSDLVHKGKNLPESIVIGHYKLLSIKYIEMQHRRLKNQQFLSSENVIKRAFASLPPLLTFERLVSYSMIGFLSKYKTDMFQFRY